MIDQTIEISPIQLFKAGMFFTLGAISAYGMIRFFADAFVLTLIQVATLLVKP